MVAERKLREGGGSVGQTSAKKPYSEPRLREWGTVTDLTQTGKTTEGGDVKTGSVSSSGM